MGVVGSGGRREALRVEEVWRAQAVADENARDLLGDVTQVRYARRHVFVFGALIKQLLWGQRRTSNDGNLPHLYKNMPCQNKSSAHFVLFQSFYSTDERKLRARHRCSTDCFQIEFPGGALKTGIGRLDPRLVQPVSRGSSKLCIYDVTKSKIYYAREREMFGTC